MQDTAHPEPHNIGIIGGGQLAMMMSESAPKIGLKIHIQTPNSSDPALSSPHSSTNGNEAILAAVDDAHATAQLANQTPVITFENEFVDVPELQKLSDRGVCFRPALSALELVLDKFDQRSQLKQMGLPVPNFAAITAQSSPSDLGFSYPMVIKARRHGYDGQGTHIIKDDQALQEFWNSQPNASPDSFMVEAFVPFDKELAVIAARSLHGEITIYPLVETSQPDQVCRWAIAPVAVSDELEKKVREMVSRLLNQLEYVGILALELFLTQSEEVLVNELAPRTHNSGHLTIEACQTSQFEQHLRAVAGHPLGETTLKSASAVMINLLGV